ncbi:MAG: NAD-dependent epimerase/dehydratase family protein [Ruminococcus flavefaciens]|nr:NAD-dependent epimerase/dehydratase family protein [Ruminococcus flavefaciens]
MALYAVTGAAGHLGSTIIRELLQRGQQIRGLILPTERPPVSGPEYICGDVTKPEALASLFRRTDEPLYVIHTAGLIDVTGAMSKRLYEVNVNGTKNLLAQCKAHHIDKLVYVSSVHAIPENNTLTIQTEISDFAPDTVIGGYAKTKAEATKAVLDAAANGLPATVVHPSGIIGPYDEGRNHLVQLIRDFAAGRLPACVRGGYDFVDVRDVASGCISAVEHGRAGECYLLTGGYHEIRELLGIVAELVGRKAPPILPMPLARMAEPLLRLLARMQKRRPLYTRYSLDTLGSLTRFSSQKAKTELGYHSRDIRDTVCDTAQWLQTHSLG